MSTTLRTELIQRALTELSLDKDHLERVKISFNYDIEHGVMRDGQSSLKMIPAHIGLPTGQESGETLSLDFGGTNIRVRRFLVENGTATIVAESRRPLILADSPGNSGYNLTTAETTADELFDFLAGVIADVVGEDLETEFKLGWTFSYPTLQDGLDHAWLINWTKEINVPGVEGEDVAALLRGALDRRGLYNVKITAIVNDTVATLLAAAFDDPQTTVAAIYGTGFNVGCLIAGIGRSGTPDIVNLEAGGFAKLLWTQFDENADAVSERPNSQRFEKMVSGRYMGALFTRIVLMALNGYTPINDRTHELNMEPFTARDLSALLRLKTRPEKFAVIADKLAPIFGKPFSLEPTELAALCGLAEAIIKRSARLVAAAFAAIVDFNAKAADGEIKQQSIAVDGSIYAKMPNVADELAKALCELLGKETAEKINLRFISEGSGYGAAIAALMTEK